MSLKLTQPQLIQEDRAHAWTNSPGSEPAGIDGGGAPSCSMRLCWPPPLRRIASERCLRTGPAGSWRAVKAAYEAPVSACAAVPTAAMSTTDPCRTTPSSSLLGDMVRGSRAVNIERMRINGGLGGVRFGAGAGGGGGGGCRWRNESSRSHAASSTRFLRDSSIEARRRLGSRFCTHLCICIG